MWNLICVSLFLIQGFCAAQSSLELIPGNQCANVQCPQLDCLNTVLINGSCCRICATEAVQGCVKDGISYEEGSIIPSNATDACEICYCCEGKITCGNISESCPQLKCNKSQQITDAEKCCARCLNENNTFSAEINATCIENGITYQEGDVWNPYFSKFGTVKCQECTCRNGTKLCKIVPCPLVRPCTADDPVEEITTCCPKCNRSSSEQQNTTINNNSTLPELNLVPDIPTESTIPCPLVYAYRVYETINATKDQIAIENISFLYVDIYVWSSESKTVQYEFQNSDRFAKQYLNVRFKYIGDTTVESVKTLVDWFNIKKKRVSLKYCKSNCSPRVIEILQPCK